VSGTVFFSITAGASATLVGLLFVAIQFTPQGIAPNLLLRRHAMARSTFSLFAVLFGLSLFFLLSTPVQEEASALIAAAVVGIFRVVRTWVPVWREMLHGRLDARIWQSAWLLIVPVISFLYLGLIGIRNLNPNANSAKDLLYSTAGTFIGLFVVALRNSWNLLVDVSPMAQAGESR
jgi:hypothetical protein